MALRAIGLAFLSSAALMALPVEGGAASEKDADDALSFEIDPLVQSDYIYRGVSLSARKPSAAVLATVDWHNFYLSGNFQSVSLPNDPALEVTLTGGYSWTSGKLELDVAANYFYYPGQMLTGTAANLNYWEYQLQATYDASPVKLQGTFAYSPNVSGTGAWGAYGEGQITYALPQLKLANPIDWQLIASAGYWRFGNTSPDQGGFPLPSYVNWRVGVAFTLNDAITFDLSYWDTNLSREDCFVFTGDPAASAGGAVDPIGNPLGLRSRLCGAALVGTLSAKIDSAKLK